MARLALKDDELSAMQRQLGAVLEHMRILTPLNSSDTIPMAHPMDTTNAWGGDAAMPGLGREAIGRMAPESAEGFVVVPKVLDGGNLG